MDFVTEKERKLPVKASYDILVAGGGIAGVAASLAAARRGAKVLLVDANCALGGLATLGLITVYQPLCDGFGNQVIFGMAEELLRLSIKNGYESRYPAAWLDGGTKEERIKKRFEVQFNAQFFALDMERILLENGVTILYHTKIYDCLTKDGKITEVFIDNKAGRSAIRAKAFVDATGDADLCYFSGEETARFEKNLLTAWYYYADKCGYRYCTQNPQNQTVFYSGFEDETEFLLKNHELIYTDAVRRKGLDSSVMPVTIPTLPEFRATRRLKGVSEPNVAQAKAGFADTIGRMGDWHEPTGIYEIPYSSLYGKNIGNLVAAGRCISNKDDFWDFTREIPVCALTGEVAGAAAAMAADENKNVAELSLEKLRKAVGYKE